MMELLNIGLVFALVFLLLVRRIDLWLTLGIGAVALGLLYRLPVLTISTVFFRGLIETKTIYLVLALLFILLLSEIMKESGEMRTMIDSFGAITGDLRAVVALLPAMIGLMPIMGGALVSAPLVVGASDALKLSPERRTFLNYWFRHIWEYFLPTYPGVILAAALVEVSLGVIAVYHFPLTLAAIGGGILFGLRHVGRAGEGRVDKDRIKGIKGICSSLFPLLVVLCMVILLRVELVYALAAAIGIELLRSRGVWVRIKEITVRTASSAQVLITVVMVLFFQQMLESTQAVDGFHRGLSQLGVPPLVLLMVLPFSIGLMTGMTIAFVGVTFPLLLPIMREGNNLAVYLMLAYASGYCGVLLSPLHLCLVLTKDYFKAELRKVYGLLVAPVGVVWGVAALLFCLSGIGMGV
jgi:integral membrane protein (TIGR00529 family)